MNRKDAETMREEDKVLRKEGREKRRPDEHMKPVIA
jgi:hypothetical protein